MALRSSEKITSREQAAKICAQCRAQGQTVGFTNGAFDIFHAGHAAYLEEARSNCDFLIVGVNSDESVRAYKSLKRPIIAQDNRIAVLASLASVDLVFIFEEPNSNQNMEIVRPSLYIKAKEYSNKPLTSAPIVEKYGGKVLLMEMKPGLSTSGIIDTVLARYSNETPTAVEKAPVNKKPAIFLDRDGTIIEHVEYLSDPKQVKIFPKAAAAIKLMREKGYWIVVTTNQPGIGLGYFSKEDFYSTNRALLRAVSAEGAAFDKVYYSPHSDGDKTDLNKPATGMIRKACVDLPIDLTRSFVIGDSTVDLQFAANAGVKSILVKTGSGGADGRFKAIPTLTAETLFDAAAQLEISSS